MTTLRMNADGTIVKALEAKETSDTWHHYHGHLFFHLDTCLFIIQAVLHKLVSCHVTAQWEDSAAI